MRERKGEVKRAQEAREGQWADRRGAGRKSRCGERPLHERQPAATPRPCRCRGPRYCRSVYPPLLLPRSGGRRERSWTGHMDWDVTSAVHFYRTIFGHFTSEMYSSDPDSVLA